MKKRLTINIDAALIPEAKRYARMHGISVSALAEEALRGLAAEGVAPPAGAPDEEAVPHEAGANDCPEFELPPRDPPREGATSWVQQWAGILEGPGPPPGEDRRYDHLARGYDP